MTDADNDVRHLIPQMPDFWHAEAKAMVARNIVAANRATMALDAAPDTLYADINRFCRGDQMPMTRAASCGCLTAVASVRTN